MSLKLPAAASLATRAPGVDILALSSPALRAEISLLGGQLLTLDLPGQSPLLYLSPDAVYQAGKAIRGGIPVCWPWFGPHPDDAGAPAHGVARNQPWRLEAVTETAAGFHVKLQGPRHQDLSVAIDYLLSADGATTRLTTRNHGAEPARLSSALHSYLAVSDAAGVSVLGVENARAHDKVADRAVVLPAAPLRFEGEVDCVVYGAQPITLRDSGWRRDIRVASRGSASSVLWNPHVDKCRRLADLPDEAWRDFVCIETANAGEDSRLLPPGAEHSLESRLQLLPADVGRTV
nr:D-hexose-6-phosphate mutarotase [Chromobacterium sp. ASV5]